MKPLSGRSVLVTRPSHQAAEMAGPLEALGARVVLLPAIGVAPPKDFSPLDSALRSLNGFEWVVLTSVNGVEAVVLRMKELGLDPADLGEPKLAVIGPATASALEREVRKPDLMPGEFVSEAIREALGDVTGLRFLLLRADIAREDLRRLLEEGGATVSEVCAYRIVDPEAGDELPEDAPDFLTFTSPSAFRGTKRLLEEQDREDWLRSARIACIGPVTAAEVERHGYRVDVQAHEYTVPGLVKALVQDVQRQEVSVV